MKFYLETFGCKSNQYESQAIRENLLKNGFLDADTPQEADIYLINTCGVTSAAVAACRSRVRKIFPSEQIKLILITGCCVDLGEAFPSNESPKVILVPNALKYRISNIIRENIQQSQVASDILTAIENPVLSVSGFEGHTRAFIKIQDGCNNYCSYCAVPYARGIPWSRPVKDILAEAERLCNAGYNELVLTGINIGEYAADGLDFSDLVETLANTQGLDRLRLGSVEPPRANPKLFKIMAANPRICHHIHLPLQSGSDKILQSMKRKYSAHQFLEIVELARSILDKPAITTDVIIGFPDENDDDFAATLNICKTANFSRIHAFPFSPRPGTPAAKMLRSCVGPQLEQRKKTLLALGTQISEMYARSLIGKYERLLVECSECTHSQGLIDRYLRASINRELPQGTLVTVKISGVKNKDGFLDCEIVDNGYN